MKLIKGVKVTTDQRMLRIRSQEVKEISADVLDTINRLKEFMGDNPKSQGISANQIGQYYKIAVIRDRRGLHTCINTKIVLPILFQLSNEGCESIPGKRYGLWRPLFGIVVYKDEQLKQHCKFVGQKMIRVYAHEVDHAKGRLISDKGREWKFDTETSGHYLSKR